MARERKVPKLDYDKGYIRDNIHQKTISFNKKKPEEEELYNWITMQPNQAQYIKNLIREDMERKKAGNKWYKL